MKKEKALIIFTDIDQTLLPIDLTALKEFVNIVKEIQEEKKVKVKLCPISGRQPVFVKGIMNFISGIFESEGVYNLVEMGAGEQGAIIVHSTEPEHLYYLANKDDLEFKKKASRVVKDSYLSRYLSETPQNVVINTFSLNEKYKRKLPVNEKEKVFTELRKLLEDKLGDTIRVSHVVDSLEIAPKNIGKDIAIRSILKTYAKRYDIVGVTFSGDSENDLSAVKFLDKLFKLKGEAVNVLLPSNAYECLDLKNMRYEDTYSKFSFNNIQRADSERFKGVLELLKDNYEKGTLLTQKGKNVIDVANIDLIQNSIDYNNEYITNAS